MWRAIKNIKTPYIQLSNDDFYHPSSVKKFKVKVEIKTIKVTNHRSKLA